MKPFNTKRAGGGGGGEILIFLLLYVRSANLLTDQITLGESKPLSHLALGL